MNPLKRDYTNFSSPHQSYARIDHILMPTRHLPNVSNSKIIDTTLSDHSIVHVSLYKTSHHPKHSQWKLNESILSDRIRVTEINKALLEYFALNDVGDTSAEVLWAAHKVTIKGKIIQIASQFKRERKADIVKLEQAYSSLKAQHKRNPSGIIISQLDAARLDLNLALTARAEKQIQWSRVRFYTQKDKLGPMLATKLSPRAKIHSLPKILTHGQTTTSDPTKILVAFKDFYNKLYSSLNRATIAPSINS